MSNLREMLDVTHVLILALAVLGCYTALCILGSDGTDALADAIKVLVGGIAGLAVAKRRVIDVPVDDTQVKVEAKATND